MSWLECFRGRDGLLLVNKGRVKQSSQSKGNVLLLGIRLFDNISGERKLYN